MKHKQNKSAVIKSIFYILFGITSASFGLKAFLIPNGFIDGGVTGISMLMAEITPFPLSVWIVLINVPFIILGAFRMTKKFAVYSVVAIGLLATVLAVVSFPVITNDKLLVSVFGGFFLGLGIGFSVRGGSVIDGTEILALTISKKTILSVGDTILILNILIFSVAGFLLGVEAALYSLLTYFVASKTIDFVIHGFEEYYGVTIVSEKHDEIRQMLTGELNKSVTLYKARGGSSSLDAEPMEVIFTIVTRLEMQRIIRMILEVDPKAFIAEHLMGDVHGGIIKKKPFFQQ